MPGLAILGEQLDLWRLQVSAVVVGIVHGAGGDQQAGQMPIFPEGAIATVGYEGVRIMTRLGFLSAGQHQGVIVLPAPHEQHCYSQCRNGSENFPVLQARHWRLLLLWSKAVGFGATACVS